MGGWGLGRGHGEDSDSLGSLWQRVGEDSASLGSFRERGLR